MPQMIKDQSDIKTAPFDPRFPNTNQTSCTKSATFPHAARTEELTFRATEDIKSYVHPRAAVKKPQIRFITLGVDITVDNRPLEVVEEYILDTVYLLVERARYCYQSYLDFHRCQKVRGENYEPCQYFKRVYSSMCPNEWVEKWDGQRAEGTFPGRI